LLLSFSFSEDSGQVRRCSHERKVWFDDEHLISGYCEASAPLFISSDETSQGCRRYRQDLLSLKGETVSAAQMEALEEIFRRVQFDILDFEYTFLDDDAAIALSEMLEFYESAQKLNLSFNKRITIRGWTDIFKACNSLQTLNLRYTSVSDKSLSTLCRTLRGTPQPVLGCLHLENVNLYGRNLYSLVCALKFNTVLRELYLGENNLQSADGAHLYQLITNNFTLQMLDLRNNQLADAGIVKLCEALRNPEVVKNSSLTALVLWNNKITANSMNAISGALCENFHIETINIGNNFIGELGVQRLRPALACNGSNLRRLGLQNTHMTCQSAILLAECLADNTTMVRVDLRDNPGIGSAGLLALHSAMKINTSISLLNLDQSCVVASSVKVSLFHKLRKKNYSEFISVNITMNVEMSPPHDQPTPLMTSSGPKGKFVRTSSLTCAETVSDIHVGLTRCHFIAFETQYLVLQITERMLFVKFAAEWSSLPAIPQANLSAKPTVRKLRRFSVSCIMYPCFPRTKTLFLIGNTEIFNFLRDATRIPNCKRSERTGGYLSRVPQYVTCACSC
uniref:Leucine-rich repeat-containing protein 68 n=1 Tax=Angiostrongylus cantonensis TaxID=6313 RepID=A0A0K0DG59_ANGCA